MIVIAHNIRSMHNVGSIFRNAAAFGIEKLYLTGITAHPPRKEIAKVALGAQDIVPWEGGNVTDVISRLKTDGYTVYGLEQGEEAIPLDQFAPSNSPMTGGGKRVRGLIDLRGVAQELRKNQTPEEVLLWGRLRNKQLKRFKFRRQHGIGPFIVDFYCDKARLVVEVDGEVHDQPEVNENDRRRNQYLSDLGYTVLRVKNKEITHDMDAVLLKIEAFLPSSYGGVGGGDFRIVERKKKLALVLGNEVDGIDPETIALLDGLIEIPMQDKKSLNVSVASGIAMFMLK